MLCRLGCAQPQSEPPLDRRASGNGVLLAAIVGSGIMAESLASGNAALALLANTIATGVALVALILCFRPDLRRPFQFRGDFVRCLARRYTLARGHAVRQRPSCRRDFRGRHSEHDVSETYVVLVAASAQRPKPGFQRLSRPSG